MLNPLQLLELKNLISRLRSNHPKFPAFLRAVMQKGIGAGTILELRVTEPDGNEYITNVRVNEDDLECIKRIMEIQKDSGSHT